MLVLLSEPRLGLVCDIGMLSNDKCLRFGLFVNLVWPQKSIFQFQMFDTIQSTTVIVETVLVETTVLVEQKPLTTQFYLLLVESPF